MKFMFVVFCLRGVWVRSIVVNHFIMCRDGGVVVWVGENMESV